MYPKLEDRMLTSLDVSRWLGIAQRTVCTWAECNELPGIKVGRQWRFRRRDLETWLQHSNPANSKLPPPPAATAAKAAYKIPHTEL